MRFTVLTPTYNRVHPLTRVFGSLRSQTFRDFEWIIVDDGSEDGTKKVASRWCADFPIHYFWKPNGGKHTAVNLGVTLAEGEFILITDSDDLPDAIALERFDLRWRDIPNPQRFAFLVALFRKPDGSLLGSPLPADHVDVFSVGELQRVNNADRWGMCRSDIFKRFLYPEFPGEKRLYEGVVWHRILRQYGARYINEALSTACYQAGGISHTGDVRAKNPRGTTLYYKELMCQPRIPLSLRTKATINTLRFAPRALWCSRIK